MWFHPSYHLAGASPLPLDTEIFFFGGIQHSPVDGCSVASCNFGVLTREDECTSSYSAVLKDRTLKDELPRSVGAQYATEEQWRNNSRKNEEMEPKQKQHPVVDVTGDGSKVRFCKEQYCIRTWNVRSMNQGKLEVIRQEMARMKVDILGISELKFTGMGEFNSDDHFIYYCGQESLRRNRVTLIVNRRVRNTVLGCNLKNDRMISVLFPRHTIQYHSNPSLWPNQQCWRSWSWMVLWRPTRPFRTNTQKRCPFHYKGLEGKSRKSGNTWRQANLALEYKMKQGKG